MKILGFVIAAGVVGLCACSSSPSSSCSSYLDALTSAETRCGATVNIDQTTKDNFKTYCASLANAPGATNFSGQVDQCASAYNSADCNSTVTCKLTGSFADGTACGVSNQCSGGRCIAGSGKVPSSEVVCGTCASYLQVGAPCGATGSCDPATSQCTNGTCVAYAAKGQSCAAAPCGSGLQCDQPTKTCLAYPTKGEACTLTCASPYRCVQSTCAEPVQKDGACPSGDECASGLTCDPQTHICGNSVRAGAGQACGFVNQSIVDCDTGLACQGTNTNGQGTCVAPKALGDACTVGQNECAEFLSCISGTCAIPDYTVCK